MVARPVLAARCWVDVRGCKSPILTTHAAARASAVVCDSGEQKQCGALPTYTIAGSDVLRIESAEVVGKVVGSSRAAILNVVRAGVYGIVLLDGADADAVAFALGRSDACRSISGINVEVAVCVESAAHIDRLETAVKITSSASWPILVIPNEAADAWRRAER